MINNTVDIDSERHSTEVIKFLLTLKIVFSFHSWLPISRASMSIPPSL